jgi:hypothetical protein
MKKIAVMTLSAVWLGTSICPAGDSTYKDLLAKVPAAELPAKSAGLIKDAKARDREVVTRDVVKSAVELNPAAAPLIVSAIAQVVPDMAALAAGVAAAEQPKQAAAIARAAAAVAPAKASKIVVAVCRAVPNDYRNIAVAVAQAVPGSGQEVLKAVAIVRPDLQPGIDRVLVSYGNNLPTVGAVLDANLTAGNGLPVSLARGPAVGPPYIPLSGTPTNVTPGGSGDVPPGGRDYAKP